MVRGATPDEISSLCQELPGYTTEGVVVCDGESIIGHAFLSECHGSIIAHDWKNDGCTPNDSAQMWFKLRDRARAINGGTVQVHFSPTDTQTAQFWANLGFVATVIIAEGQV